MTRRQALILQTAVREHIRTGEPVGSETLVSRGRIPLSPATVRAELASLEQDGFLRQPHASAGRVPTTAGYRQYVDACLEQLRQPRPLSSHQAFEELEILERMSEQLLVRELAHTLAKRAGTLSVVAAPDALTHEAGFTNLFQTPEFREDPGGADIDRLIEAVEERGREFSALAETGPAVFIDGENPFVRTRLFSMVVAALVLPSGARVVAALIGPLRMPYERHLQLMDVLQRELGAEESYHDA